MAANEKQLEKVTLTLTNKMVVGRPDWSTNQQHTKFQLNSNNINLAPYPCKVQRAWSVYIKNTCTAANLTQILSHPSLLFLWQLIPIT